MNPLDKYDRYYFLHPGQLLITKDPVPVVTILGSCIAVTIYSPHTGLSGIFHAMLPEHRIKKNIIAGHPPVSPDPEYVDFAFYYLKHRFGESGISLCNTSMMLFGGSDVLRTVNPSKNGTVGRQNILMARKIIDRELITLACEDTGGNNGRKIVYLPHEGKAYVHYLDNAAGIFE
ncbi:MAG TPA: chemotaxis protein CheD [Spirochaetota bacterium]|nr:chemotaxis protein CheD [Spirochaetota bacterium]HQO40747.1 chemotaxis protein CheD [Spirochaetota bacterium]